MAPRNKKSTKNEKLRRSPRLRKSTPCPGLSFPIRKKTKCGKAKRTKNASKGTRRSAPKRNKRIGRSDHKNIGIFALFFKHVAHNAKNDPEIIALKLSQPQLMQQAGHCWNSLTKAQRADFTRRTNVGHKIGNNYKRPDSGSRGNNRWISGGTYPSPR